MLFLLSTLPFWIQKVVPLPELEMKLQCSWSWTVLLSQNAATVLQDNPCFGTQEFRLQVP